MKGTLQAHVDNMRLQTHAHLLATGAQFIDFSATVPIHYNLYPFAILPDQKKPVSSELVIEGKLQDLFDFINLGINQAAGYVSARLLLSQTLENPSLVGDIEWKNGSYENYFTGTSLKDVNATLQAQKDRIVLLSLSARDDKEGTVTGDGTIYLKPHEHIPYAFNATLTNLNALRFNPINGTLTGPLTIKGNTNGCLAQGNLLVPQAIFTLSEQLVSETPILPVTYINRPHFLSSKALVPTTIFPFQTDLELTAEHNIHVDGKGLKSEWKGDVHVTGTNRNIIANGTLHLIKGEYTLLGKVFKLSEGQIVFNDKPTPTAMINVSGNLSMPEMTITAYLRGPLSAPTLTFQSNPQMSTSAILARMLFNKDISDISQPEAIQLASTLISLSGGAGPAVLETIRKNIGVDRLTIASQNANPDEIAVHIGKYLTKGVLVTLSQSATSSQVIVEVELSRGFVFQAETQEEEEGKFSLKWTHSY